MLTVLPPERLFVASSLEGSSLTNLDEPFQHPTEVLALVLFSVFLPQTQGSKVKACQKLCVRCVLTGHSDRRGWNPCVKKNNSTLRVSERGTDYTQQSRKKRKGEKKREEGGERERRSKLYVLRARGPSAASHYISLPAASGYSVTITPQCVCWSCVVQLSSQAFWWTVGK